MLQIHEKIKQARVSAGLTQGENGRKVRHTELPGETQDLGIPPP